MASPYPGNKKIGQYNLGKAICSAICNDQLHLNFQPKHFMANNKLQGAEALLRWQHPDFGYISPGYFVPFAERYGLASELFEWVLFNTCRQITEWESAGLNIPGISVNISPACLEERLFVSNTMNCIESFGIKPEIIEIEITETSIFNKKDQQIKALRELMENGIGIALDDFGAGFSSISHLIEVPLSAIKIDKFFIDQIEQDKGKQLVESIIRLGHEMGLTVTAEGVELATQVAQLRKSGCDIAQGYFFSKPVSGVELESILRHETANTYKPSDQEENPSSTQSSTNHEGAYHP